MDKIETTPAGSRRHSFVGVKGDLRVELHYADIHDGNGRQACLYLFKTNAPKDGVLVPFAGMWRYAQHDALHTVVVPIARKIYGIDTRMDQVRVLDAILDYLEDLKNHKPEAGVDKTLDEFLEECEGDETPFFLEIGGTRVI